MKVNTVTRALKPYACRRCGAVIPKGAPYRWWARYGERTRHVHCMLPGCAPSERDWDERVARLLEIQAGLREVLPDLADVESIQSALEDAASEAQDVAAEWQESIDNIEGAFPDGTPVSEAMNEKSDAAEAWADELTGVDCDPLEEADWREEHAEGIAETGGDLDAAWLAALAAHLEEARAAADEACESLEIDG
jgi:hypothetical protein